MIQLFDKDKIYDYCYDEIKNAYALLGVCSGETVFLESDIASLGIYEQHKSKTIVSDHYRALKTLVGDDGTIVVPSFTTYLCNNKIPYNSSNSISEMGILSEYIRQLPGAVRSYHALTSYVAIGKKANKICKDVSRLAYGPESPMDRMINYDTRFISIGLKPFDTCSTVHQAELVMGVPYRYIKEFEQQVVNNGRVNKEYFYMHVRYETSKIEKDKRHLFSLFEAHKPVLKCSLGRGVVYGYSMKDFYQHSIKYFRMNPYAILANIPKNKPYAKTM
jgi:aminoglycoside 3-N-acetyltransferase